MKDIYYVDGRYVADDQCLIPARDLIVLRGFGVFDFLVTYNKQPFHLRAHADRLANSARHIGLKLNHTPEEICRIVEATVGRNTHHTESNIRMVYTGGVSSDGVTPQGNGILIVMVTPKPEMPAEWYTDGAKVVTNRIERVIPDAKSTNYLSAVYAMEEAHRQDAIESIYMDRRDCLLEGTTSNIFFFSSGKLVTSNRDILPGVTRQVLLDLLQDHFQVDTRDVRHSELPAMEEVFITSSNKEVVPVIQVDGITIGSGRPGPQTQKVMALFRAYTAQYGQKET